MDAYSPPFLPLDSSLLNPAYYYEELIDATAKLEVYKEKLKDSKLGSHWFLPTLQQKEALASALLEGTQATLDGVLINQISPNEKDKNLREIVNYSMATQEGYDYLSKGGLINIEFIKGLHSVLMSGNVRGKNISNGEFRTKQNYIGKMGKGGSTGQISYIPPVHENVAPLMDNLVEYIQSPTDGLRPLVRTAIIHSQLETIHPFMDGNGRLGRILIPLYLYQQKQFNLPCFFISEALERDKYKYYKLLNDTRFSGNWNEWIKFFLQAVITQCVKYINMVEQINELYKRDVERSINIVKNSKIIDIINLLYKFPVVTSSKVVEKTGVSPSSASRYLTELAKNGIIYSDEKQRNRTYYYYDLINILRN